MDNIRDTIGLSGPARDAKLVKLIVIVISALLIFMIAGWIYSKLTLKEKNCQAMTKLYKDFPTITTMNKGSDEFSHALRDYYVKTAYNCCATGTFKNTFVDTCGLKNCIRQGARCLDFQIYSVKDEPVIAVSSVSDFSVKESYNSVPFGTAMGVIADYAFAGSTCPCPGDPLIIHLRIMSKNLPIMDKMATDLYNTLERRLLGKKYSYENQGKNLGKVPIQQLMGKVVVIVDKSLADPTKTKLDEYVNICSNSVFMRALSYHEVQYTPDMNELIEYNKKNMTICLPDLGTQATNPSAALAWQYGCQFVAMSFQNFDQNLEYSDLFFDSAGSAFSLKPANLRFIPVTIPVPGPPPEEYSYAKRTVSSDYYKFNI